MIDAPYPTATKKSTGKRSNPKATEPPKSKRSAPSSPALSSIQSSDSESIGSSDMSDSDDSDDSGAFAGASYDTDSSSSSVRLPFFYQPSLRLLLLLRPLLHYLVLIHRRNLPNPSELHTNHRLFFSIPFLIRRVFSMSPVPAPIPRIPPPNATPCDTTVPYASPFPCFPEIPSIRVHAHAASPSGTQNHATA